MKDMMKIAQRIRNARNAKDLTQMDVANALGVSYRTVCNWECGNTIPDIQEITLLCGLLELSVEELFGEASPETATIEKLIKGEGDNLSPEELAMVGNIVKPKNINHMIGIYLQNGEDIPFSTILSLAPFLNQENMDDAIEQYMDTYGFRFKKLLGLTPYLSETSIKKIADRLATDGEEEKIVELSCFMGTDMKEAFPNGIKIEPHDFYDDEDNENDPDELIREYQENKIQNAIKEIEKGADIKDIVPYLSEDTTDKLAFAVFAKGVDFSGLLGYMSEHMVGELAQKLLREGKDFRECVGYMAEEDVNTLAYDALELGADISECATYMNTEHLIEFTQKMFDMGKDISICLDRMKKKTIVRLATKLLDRGKSIDRLYDRLGERTYNKLLDKCTNS